MSETIYKSMPNLYCLEHLHKLNWENAGLGSAIIMGWKKSVAKLLLKVWGKRRRQPTVRRLQSS